MLLQAFEQDHPLNTFSSNILRQQLVDHPIQILKNELCRICKCLNAWRKLIAYDRPRVNYAMKPFGFEAVHLPITLFAQVADLLLSDSQWSALDIMSPFAAAANSRVTRGKLILSKASKNVSRSEYITNA